jgi:hypothetical protein
MVEETNVVHIFRLNLQQSSYASIGITAPLRILLAALNQGWQVEEPVEVMSTVCHDLWIYCFVIRYSPLIPLQRLYIPASQEVERFVEQSRYQVIEGSYIESL